MQVEKNKPNINTLAAAIGPVSTKIPCYKETVH